MTIKSTHLFSIIFVLVGLFWPGYSQAVNRPISKEISLLEAIEKISQEYEVYFTFDMNLVTDVKVEYTHESYGSAVEAISHILRGTNLKYKFYDQRFVILYTEDAEGIESLKKMSQHLEGLISEGEKTIAATPIRKNRAIPFLKNEIISRPIAPITFTVQGIVTDQSGEPLIGVNIQVKGTNKGTASDFDGHYVLEDIDENAILVISYIGYQTLEIPVAGNSTLNIVLLQDSQLLDEVVVVGYGTQKKSDVTGSITRVGESEIRLTPVVDVNKALQGHSAGVLITQNAGDPGAGSTIRIRGTSSINASNSPLYVLDGYPLEGSDISFIDPSSIQSIDILKDASATSIYGSRGSNGVVLITTKKGTEGKTRISLDSYYGIQSIRHKIPLLNGEQYAEFINEARINGGGEAYFDGSSPERPLPTAIGKGTDWQDEVFQTAPIQQHSLSILGGTNQTKFSIIGSLYDQDGIIINSGYNRYSIRANIDHEINEFVILGISLAGSRSNNNAARTATGGGVSGGITNAALNFAPSFPVYDENGTYYKNKGSLNGSLVDNPVALANEVTNQSLRHRFLSNIYAEIKFLKDFKFRTSWGGDIGSSKTNNYFSRLVVLGEGQNGVASISEGTSENWLSENTLTYSKWFNDIHDFNALIGYTIQQTHYESLTATAENFNSDFSLYYNLGSGSTLKAPASGESTHMLISYLGRINYSYANRYLLTATVRRDGSSRFAPNNKFGIFPSFALGWKILNEPFIGQLNRISDLKLRMSYGTTGNEGIGDYRFMSLIGTHYYPLGLGNPETRAGNAPSSLSNESLSWEKNTQLNIGLDFEVANNFFVVADYYNSITSDLLFSVNIPSSSGYSSSLQNIGELQNKGFELGVGGHLSRNAFKWESRINLSYNENKVLKLDGRPQFTTGGGIGHLVVSNTVLLDVGHSVGNFYGLKKIGIFNSEEEIAGSAQVNAQPGDIKYEDINQDGIINEADRTVIGNGNPKYFGGFNNTFYWHNFKLNVFLQGAFGNEILNFQRFDLYNLNGNNNQSIEILDRWTPTNTNTDIPRANSRGGSRTFSSFHVEDGSYLRVKNITLGYDFNRNILNKLHLSKLNIYCTLQNWFTVTKYTGYDPEINYFGTSAINQGMDYQSYPSSKTVLFGLSIGF